MKVVFFISLVLSLFFLSTSNPITMVVFIMLQSLTVCLMLFLFLGNSWFAYILFLIFMGGMMIPFVYMCSVASNELFETKLRNSKTLLLKLMFAFISALFIEFTMKYVDVSLYMINSKMMAMMNASLMIMTMLFLLFSLLVVVKISHKKGGPLRSTKK